MSTRELSDRQCIPCKGDVPPLKGDELHQLHQQIDDGWQLVEEHHLERVFDFPDFQTALDFTVAIGDMAEEQDHHPVIRLTWGEVGLEIYTHKIDGLTESDFVWAAKADRIYRERSGDGAVTTGC